MVALSNHKHELFAQALAKGETADAAYVMAGYKENRGNAATLKAKQNIADRVAELLDRAAAKTEKTVADLVIMLEEDRSLARAEKQSSAAVAAVMGMGKLLGHLKDKVEHSGSIGSPAEYEAAAEAEVAELFGAPRLVVNNG
jgi:phage terminase small subunit